MWMNCVRGKIHLHEMKVGKKNKEKIVQPTEHVRVFMIIFVESLVVYQNQNFAENSRNSCRTPTFYNFTRNSLLTNDCRTGNTMPQSHAALFSVSQLTATIGETLHHVTTAKKRKTYRNCDLSIKIECTLCLCTHERKGSSLNFPFPMLLTPASQPSPPPINKR